MDMPNIDLFSFIRVTGLVPALLVLIGTFVGVGVVRGAAMRLARQFAARRFLIEQVATFIRFAVWMVGISVAVVLIFSLDEKVLLALGGTAAVTIGFALKDLAAAVIAGVIILIDKPFQVGDRVTFDGAYGEVHSIGLRSVQLITLDDTLVTIPNNKFLTDAVSSGNAGNLDMMIQQHFFVDCDQDIATARQIVAEAICTTPYASLKKPWSVVVNQVRLANTFSLRLTARVYVMDVRYELDLQSDVTERVVEGLQAARIRPFVRPPRAGLTAPDRHNTDRDDPGDDDGGDGGDAGSDDGDSGNA
jgi:small-conductance mechanosensitive channel